MMSDFIAGHGVLRKLDRLNFPLPMSRHTSRAHGCSPRVPTHPLPLSLASCFFFAVPLPHVRARPPARIPAFERASALLWIATGAEMAQSPFGRRGKRRPFFLSSSVVCSGREKTRQKENSSNDAWKATAAAAPTGRARPAATEAAHTRPRGRRKRLAGESPTARN